ncbi:hypothetical protein DWUX_2354 [Desulfovibrio diazotrophicus]|nr:hypothetical protein DWUX_2354 [Desulfovibrio diazotrophicus]
MNKSSLPPTPPIPQKTFFLTEPRRSYLSRPLKTNNLLKYTENVFQEIICF